MPRLKISDEETKKKSMRGWIKSQLSENGITQTQISNRMNITPRGFRYKMKSLDFSYFELITLFTMLDTDEKEIARLMKL